MTVTNEEYMGVPSIKVVLNKKSQQYIIPDSELDLSVNDFHQKYSDPNLRNKNH